MPRGSGRNNSNSTAAAGAGNNNANDYARETNHNPDGVWNSTHHYCWDQVMAPIGLAFDDIEWADLEGDGSILMLARFVQRANTNPPLQRDRSKPYNARTVSECFGAGVRKLREKFRQQIGNNLQLFFPDDQVKELKNKIKNNLQRNLMIGDNEDDLFKNSFPIPREYSDRCRVYESQNIPEAKRNEAGNPNIDMLYICTNLFMEGKFRKLLKLLLTFNGIGRGGESKFVDYEDMFLDLFYNVLFCQWFQRKTLKTNPSGFVPDFQHSVLCVFLAFGCFWACDKGLYRPEGIAAPNTAQHRKQQYVFQDLHLIRDDGVSEQLTDIIRLYIPACIAAFYTAKSLRVGAMSMLAWDPAVTYEEAVALGGWSTGSSRDYYVWQYLIAIIPAILTLAGYPDARVLPVLPSIKILEEHPELQERERLSAAHANELIDVLFHLKNINTLKSFKRDYEKDEEGRHRSFARCVVAVMIMHFDEHYEKLTANHAYTRAMITAVTKCGVPGGQTHSDAVTLLGRWGRLIKKRFHDDVLGRNSNLLRRRSIPDQIEKLNDSVAKLLQSKNMFYDEIAAVKSTVAKQGDQIRALSTQVLSLQEGMKVVIHQNRNLQLRMNELMSHQGIAMAPLEEIPLTHTQTQAMVDTLMATELSPTALQELIFPGRAGNNPQPGHTSVTPPAAAQPNPTIAPPAVVAATPARPGGQQGIAQFGVAGQRTTTATTQVRRSVPLAQVQQVAAFSTTGGQSGKGNSKLEESLENVLLFMYDYKNGLNYRNLGTLNDCKLFEQKAAVHHAIFGGDSRKAEALVKVLKLVDCLWTPEERNICIRHAPLEDPIRFFMNIAERCKLASWLMRITHEQKEHNKKRAEGKTNEPYKLPKDWKPSKQSKTQVQGMSNNIGKFKLEGFMPKWETKKPHPTDETTWDYSHIAGRTSAISLQQWTAHEQTKLKAQVQTSQKNVYSRSGNKRQRR